MAEVLTTFKTSDQTFFLAVNLMDRFFKQTKDTINSKELHLIGITAMFLAAKYEDVVPILMRTAVNKIGHNKFSAPQIQAKEVQILQTLQFRIGAPTVKEFLDSFFEELASSNMLPT